MVIVVAEIPGAEAVLEPVPPDPDDEDEDDDDEADDDPPADDDVLDDLLLELQAAATIARTALAATIWSVRR
jgi:hypothetical protein